MNGILTKEILNVDYDGSTEFSNHAWINGVNLSTEWTRPYL